jgi:spore maturation protein CgeB
MFHELDPALSRGFYSSAKINLNYHIADQKILDSEINERTFVISACGGFQLVDNPKALPRFYSTEDMAVAVDEKDYVEKFEYYLNKPEERHGMGLKALMKSYENKYSLFHRIEDILNKIQ